jgi:hypothetical protein
MSDQPCLATIRGLPHHPSITEVNVRAGPGTNYTIVLQGPVGMSGMDILEVRADEEGRNLNGKVYQWFKLTFHGGGVGWVRDDLLDIQGACEGWGYTTLSDNTFAFALNRQVNVEQVDEAENARSPTSHIASTREAASVSSTPPVTPTPVGPSDTATDDLEQVKRASFAVTAAFEGSGYGAYNNYDAGIVSYGLIQFTLAAGSLFAVVERYLSLCDSPVAQELRNFYTRIRERDPGLRSDVNLRRILIEAANEMEMRRAQDEIATINYWDKVVEGYISHRGLKLPLSYALLFDMGVNFGTGHGFVRLAEQELGVPQRSKPGENGITEEQLIEKVAELRRTSHYRQAERDNLPGLRVRGDFWMDMVRKRNWNFIGDSAGTVIVNGRKVQISHF